MAHEERPPYPSTAALIEAGKACFDWVVDTGDCHLCGYSDHSDETHDEDCPLFVVPAGL